MQVSRNNPAEQQAILVFTVEDRDRRLVRDVIGNEHTIAVPPEMDSVFVNGTIGVAFWYGDSYCVHSVVVVPLCGYRGTVSSATSSCSLADATEAEAPRG